MFALKDQCPVEFQSAIPLGTPQGQRWMRMVGWICDTPSSDEGELPALVTTLLTCQPSNYSAELCADTAPSIAPSFAKRVERYIEEHAHEPLTIGDLAAYAEVSSRALFTGFRRFRNTSPIQYIKEVRLRHVCEELQRAQPASGLVTAVAFKWGVAHLGHFTTDYKRRFGESPSETLVR